MSQYTIDCSSKPGSPIGLGVHSHMHLGSIVWDSTKYAHSLFLSGQQKGQRLFLGVDLYEELTGKLVVNADVLDHLLIHQELIPESWKAKKVFFWGTIYCGFGGSKCVRFLTWQGLRWHSDNKSLGSYWNSNEPALLLIEEG